MRSRSAARTDAREADGHAGKAGMASKRHRKRCRGPHVLRVGALERRLGTCVRQHALEDGGADGRAGKARTS
jgi:hypothetical protein